MVLNNLYNFIKILTSTPNENNTYPVYLKDTNGNTFTTVNGQAGTQIRNAFNYGWDDDGTNDSIKIQLGIIQGDITPNTYNFDSKNESLSQITTVTRTTSNQVIDIVSNITNNTSERVSFNAVGLQLKTYYNTNFRGKFLLTAQKKDISIAPYDTIIIRIKVNY